MADKLAFGMLADKLRNVAAKIEAETYRILKKYDDKLLELNQQQMYNEGRKPNGRKIGKYTNKKYAAKKVRMNPRTADGVPDLKLSGDFYESMGIRVDASGVEIYSDIDYFKYIEGRYGNPLGLTANSQAKLIKENIIPDLLKWFLNVMK